MNNRELFLGESFIPQEEVMNAEQLKEASAIMKKEFPNGPKVRTVYPDKNYTAAEIFEGLVQTKAQISKSLYHH